ncbi:MAG: DUF167 domain-containing protein [Thermoplasmata archaeon]
MNRPTEFVKEARGGCLVYFVVSPGARSTEISGIDAWRGAVQVRVAAEPRDGAANAELVEFLSRKLSVPVSAITVVKGSKTHRKSVFVPLSIDDVKSKLGLE